MKFEDLENGDHFRFNQESYAYVKVTEEYALRTLYPHNVNAAGKEHTWAGMKNCPVVKIARRKLTLDDICKWIKS